MCYNYWTFVEAQGNGKLRRRASCEQLPSISEDE